MTTLTVAIATYNRAEALRKVLRALDGQTLTRVPWDVIVLDNGSTDGTEDALRAIAKRVSFPLSQIVIHGIGRMGPGEAMSEALRSALDLNHADVIVSLGDDMVPRPDYLENVLRWHEERPDPNVAVLATAEWHRDLPRTALMDFVERHGNQFDYGGIGDPENAGFRHAYITNLSFKRDLLERQEMLLDPALTGAYDDIEFGYRLEQQGVRFAYCAAAVAEHYDCKTFGSFLWRTYLAGRNDPVFAMKHRELDGPLLAAGNVALSGWTPRGTMPIEEGIRAWEGVERFGAQYALAPEWIYQTAIGNLYLAGVADGIATSEYRPRD